MDTACIAGLLEPFLDRPLAPAQLDQTLTYINLLLRWNARINLTAIRDPEEVVTRHFGESFFLARHLFPLVEPEPGCKVLQDRARILGANLGAAPPTATRVLDLGSGAGFPALPVKIWAPHIHLALIEANHKKAAFLREAARALTLTDVNVIAERAESVAARLAPALAPASVPDNVPADYRVPAVANVAAVRTAFTLFPIASVTPFPATADVVTLRAIENFDRILPLAASFLGPGSRLALLLGSSQLQKLEALKAFRWSTATIPHSRTRVLSIGERVLSGAEGK
jgi:16S rRNA (guanine527-N7)-methyltransferase